MTLCALQRRYLALVSAAAEAYGKGTGFFLACGPMSTDYCPEVEWVIEHATATGIKAYLLNQSSFENGTVSDDASCHDPVIDNLTELTQCPVHRVS